MKTIRSEYSAGLKAMCHGVHKAAQREESLHYLLGSLESTMARVKELIAEQDDLSPKFRFDPAYGILYKYDADTRCYWFLVNTVNCKTLAEAVTYYERYCEENEEEYTQV